MRSDNELRREVERELEWEPSVDDRRIGVSVVDGIVTLNGEVTSYSEKWRAERAVERVEGVRGIVNLIVVKPRVEPEDIKKKIEETFKRDAIVDANHITVEVNGAEVTLRGTVRSWVERHEAEKAAWSAPGVTAVHNYVTVSAAA